MNALAIPMLPLLLSGCLVYSGSRYGVKAPANAPYYEQYIGDKYLPEPVVSRTDEGLRREQYFRADGTLSKGIIFYESGAKKTLVYWDSSGNLYRSTFYHEGGAIKEKWWWLSKGLKRQVIYDYYNSYTHAYKEPLTLTVCYNSKDEKEPCTDRHYVAPK